MKKKYSIIAALLVTLAMVFSCGELPELISDWEDEPIWTLTGDYMSDKANTSWSGTVGGFDDAVLPLQKAAQVSSPVTYKFDKNGLLITNRSANWQSIDFRLDSDELPLDPATTKYKIVAKGIIYNGTNNAIAFMKDDGSVFTDQEKSSQNVTAGLAEQNFEIEFIVPSTKLDTDGGGSRVRIASNGGTYDYRITEIEVYQAAAAPVAPPPPPVPEFGAIAVNRTTSIVPTTSTQAGGSLVFELTADEKAKIAANADKSWNIAIKFQTGNWWDQYRVILGTDAGSSYDGLNFGWLTTTRDPDTDYTTGDSSDKDRWYIASGTISDISKVQYIIFHRSNNSPLAYDPGWTGSGNDRIRIFKSIQLWADDDNINVFSTNELGRNVVKYGTALAQKFDTGIEVKGRTANSGLAVVTNSAGLGLNIMKGYRITVQGMLLADPGFGYELDDSVDPPVLVTVPNTETVSLQPLSTATNNPALGSALASIALSGADRNFTLTGDFYFPQAGFGTSAGAFDNFADYSAEVANFYGIRIATNGTTDFLVSRIVIDWIPVPEDANGNTITPAAPADYNAGKPTLGRQWGGNEGDANCVFDNTTGEFTSTNGQNGMLQVYWPAAAVATFYNKAKINITVTNNDSSTPKKPVKVSLVNHTDQHEPGYAGPGGQYRDWEAGTFDLELDLDKLPTTRFIIQVNGQGGDCSDSFVLKFNSVTYIDKK